MKFLGTIIQHHHIHHSTSIYGETVLVMGSPHICLACRRRLSQLRTVKTAQWQPRAGFVSLSNSQPRISAGERSKASGFRPAERDRDRRDPYVEHSDTRRKPAFRPSTTDPGDVLESLFEKSIRPHPVREEEPREAQSSLEPYKHAETLRKMIAESYPYPESWAFFVEHFGPSTVKFSENRTAVPSYLRPTANNLLRRIIRAKAEHPMSQTLPSVTELSRVFVQLGFLQSSDWATMVSILSKNLLRIGEEEAADSQAKDRLISDLLGAWNVVCRDPDRLQNFSEDVSSGAYWLNLPHITLGDTVSVHKRRGTQGVFGLLFPLFGTRDLSSVAVVTLASFGFLSDRSHTAGYIGVDPSPLLMVMSRIISVPGLDISHIFSSAEDPHADLTRYIKADWNGIRDRASSLSHYTQTDKLYRRPDLSYMTPQKNISFINKRLYDSLHNRRPRQVDELWADVARWPLATPGMDGRDGMFTIELANYFILVYMGLRLPNQAIQVWNHIVALGLTPNLRTWDSMMNGCKSARDGKALEQVWRKMQASQVQPDAHCWTSRVGGLIECRDINAGVGALDEMGRSWLEAAKKKHANIKDAQLRLMNIDVDGAVKPNIEVVNAAMGALLRKKMPGPAYKILSWANKLGISPDVITYNIMLRPLIRAGHTKEAMALLQRMQKAGIQADVATFTTILDETFSSAQDLSPEETKATVRAIIEEMEAAGVNPNQHTYSKLIFSLLGNSSGDMTTINAIMEHMAERGIDTNATIHTMLMTHHFDQDPPNLDAVRNIIERATGTAGGIDHVFWDRAVEGYARVGETGPALKILGKLQAVNNKIGWVAMRMLLLALVNNQEWDLAGRLVDNAVLDEGGPLPEDTHGAHGQHKFWKLAKELDMLKKKEPVMTEQEIE